MWAIDGPVALATDLAVGFDLAAHVELAASAVAWFARVPFPVVVEAPGVFGGGAPAATGTKGPAAEARTRAPRPRGTHRLKL